MRPYRPNSLRSQTSSTPDGKLLTYTLQAFRGGVAVFSGCRWPLASEPLCDPCDDEGSGLSRKPSGASTFSDPYGECVKLRLSLRLSESSSSEMLLQSSPEGGVGGEGSAAGAYAMNENSSCDTTALQAKHFTSALQANFLKVLLSITMSLRAAVAKVYVLVKCTDGQSGEAGQRCRLSFRNVQCCLTSSGRH